MVKWSQIDVDSDDFVSLRRARTRDSYARYLICGNKTPVMKTHLFYSTLGGHSCARRNGNFLPFHALSTRYATVVELFSPPMHRNPFSLSLGEPIEDPECEHHFA